MHPVARRPLDWIPLSQRGNEAITIAPEDGYGWACYWPASENSRHRAVVRIGRHREPKTRTAKAAARGDFFTVFQVFLWTESPDGGRLGRPHLRQLPLNRIEAAVNLNRYRKVIANRAASPDAGRLLPDMEPSFWTSAIGPRADRWLHRPAVHDNPPPTMRFLDAPGRKPDNFYIAVSDAFLWLTAAGWKSPVTEIAEANEVDDTTVHRWLKEARRRRLLMPPMPKLTDTDMKDDS